MVHRDYLLLGPRKFFPLLALFFTFFLSVPVSELLSEQYVIYFDTAESSSPRKVGGKAANLLLLQTINGISVPEWFCVSTEAFHTYLLANNIYPLIDKLDALCVHFEPREEPIARLGKEIQNAILNGTAGKELLEEIETGYNKLLRAQHTSFAIRSSGELEDLSQSSFAGLYDSYLNQKGFENVYAAIKKVWASSFTLRVIAERSRAKIRQKDCLIAAIVQRMIQAKAAGVASSIEISSNYPGVEISANYGTGESAVGGELSVDKWLVHPREHYILKSVVGKKEYHVGCADQGTSLCRTEDSKQKEPSLQPEEVLKIAEKVKAIRNSYGCEVDTEFAFDSDGSLYFVQARPIVQLSGIPPCVVDSEDAKLHTLIASGDYSVPGVASGRLKFIDRWEDLANKTVCIEPDDIVVTYVAINYWSHYLTQFKGLITKQGGPTTHPILLCRERKVPCLIGIGDDFENLRAYSGKMITLDGFGRVVYAGEVVLKEADSAQMMKAFEPVRVRKWKAFEDRIYELKKGGYSVDLDGAHWLREPVFPSKKLFQGIYLKRAERLPLLINGHSKCTFNMRVIDNYVCSLLEPAEMYVAPFKGMTVEECEVFCGNYEKRIQDYLRVVKNFKLDSCSWQKYVDTVCDLYAYAWVAEIFRMYVDRQAEILAASLCVPQHYFDECSSFIQSQLPEEDVSMQRDIYALATVMQSLSDCSDVFDVRKKNPSVFEEIEKLAKSYRFTSNIAIERDPDLNVVYKRLLEEVDQIRQGKTFTTMKKHSHNCCYFPQHSSLYRWMYVSIRNRVLQSNAHHYIARAQWGVRDELLCLGEHCVERGKVQLPADIFDLPSEEVGLLIREREEGRGE